MKPGKGPKSGGNEHIDTAISTRFLDRPESVGDVWSGCCNIIIIRSIPTDV